MGKKSRQSLVDQLQDGCAPPQLQEAFESVCTLKSFIERYSRNDAVMAVWDAFQAEAAEATVKAKGVPPTNWWM